MKNSDLLTDPTDLAAEKKIQPIVRPVTELTVVDKLDQI
jgi:hypothetical protein